MKLVFLCLAPVALARSSWVSKHHPNCNQCPNDGSACFLPGPTDSQYVECSNGTPNTMSCASGLVWNQELETCDWPSNDSSDGGHQRRQWFNICNMCKFYPNQYGSCYMPSYNPTKYITCANGQAYKQSCPSGLVWSQRLETCNWPRHSKYGSSSDSAPQPSSNECENCVPNEYGTCFLNGPTSQQYIECSNGSPTTKTCPNQLVWNQDLETCDWPESDSSDSNSKPASTRPNVCSLCPFLQNKYGSCFVPAINPKKYISCDNGEPVQQSCGEGTVWNQWKQTCDYPWYQKVEDYAKEHHEPADGSSDTSNKRFTNWVCTMCIFTKNEYGSCYLPSWNPTKYIQCDNGVAVKQVCSSGLVWNQKLETCDWPASKARHARAVNKQWSLICHDCEPNEYGTCFQPAVEPHHFYECTNGEAERKTCPSGLVWNQELETCDWA